MKKTDEYKENWNGHVQRMKDWQRSLELSMRSM
jgi:hypothetical protein